MENVQEMPKWQDRLERYGWLDKKEKEFFIDFVEASKLKRRPIGDSRADKYLLLMAALHKLNGKGLFENTKDMKNIKAAVFQVNECKRFKFETKKALKWALGIIFNFKHNKEPSLKYAPRELKELSYHDAKASDKRIAREIITREEMRELISYGNTLDEAIISLIFESGMRIGEFIQLKKSDINPIKEGLEVRVPAGKTGERLIVVVEAKSYVLEWLNKHPIKQGDPLVWTSPETKRPLTTAAIAKRIRIVAEKLNANRIAKGLPEFNKSVNPHNFRHSRASELGGEAGMTEAIMCKFFGWEHGSDMPGTYLHLTSDQVKKAVLRTYGRAKKEEDKKIVTHRTCPTCKFENPLQYEGMEIHACIKCTQPLDSNKEITRIGEMQEQIKAMQAQMKEVQERLVQGDISNYKLAEERTMQEMRQKVKGRKKKNE